MLNLLVKWVVFAALIIFTAYVIPGISVENFGSAMIACIIIALINTFIKPIVKLISLPVNFLTLGLFSLVINALLLMLAGYVTPGFGVEGFFSALFGSILLSLFAGIVNKINLK
ncbi:MAG: phage holin family protein [Candidatus Gastranaerophilaceae bacterium]|nr:phage holin family protein [Candidatus Gastranaerophilaceae bacterium]